MTGAVIPCQRRTDAVRMLLDAGAVSNGRWETVLYLHQPGVPLRAGRDGGWLDSRVGEDLADAKQTKREPTDALKPACGADFCCGLQPARGPRYPYSTDRTSPHGLPGAYSPMSVAFDKAKP